MNMITRNIFRNLRFLFIFIIIGSVLIYIAYIQGLFVRISLEKQEFITIKVVSYNELSRMHANQSKLKNELRSEKTTIWLANEILIGSHKMMNNVYFMDNNTKYNLIEIKLPTTRYVDDNNVIEFFSDEGVITKLHSGNGWIIN